MLPSGEAGQDKGVELILCTAHLQMQKVHSTVLITGMSVIVSQYLQYTSQESPSACACLAAYYCC